jgi:hypothetical protein
VTVSLKPIVLKLNEVQDAVKKKRLANLKFLFSKTLSQQKNLWPLLRGKEKIVDFSNVLANNNTVVNLY